MNNLLDAIKSYNNLTTIGYFFTLRYSKKGKYRYDKNFLLKFSTANFRHVLGIHHLDKQESIEFNSKILFKDLRDLDEKNCMENKNFNRIVSDSNYYKIADRLETIKNFNLLISDPNVKIYEKSQSPKVLTQKIPFDFLIKLNSEGNDCPFLFVIRDTDDGIVYNPVTTFCSNKNYEQNHNYRVLNQLYETKLIR